MLGTDPIIVGGDFNCSLDNDQKRDSSISVLKDTVTSINLKDLWECGSDLKKKQTWKNKKAESRIDYIFISDTIRAKQYDTKETCFSDHTFLTGIVEIDGGIQKKSPYWKLNILLLKEDKIKAEFENVYKKWKEDKEKYDDIFVWWDEGKKIFKNFFIKKGKELAKKKKREIYIRS